MGSQNANGAPTSGVDILKSCQKQTKSELLLQRKIKLDIQSIKIECQRPVYTVNSQFRKSIITLSHRKPRSNESHHENMSHSHMLDPNQLEPQKCQCQSDFENIMDNGISVARANQRYVEISQWKGELETLGPQSFTCS